MKKGISGRSGGSDGEDRIIGTITQLADRLWTASARSYCGASATRYRVGFGVE